MAQLSSSSSSPSSRFLLLHYQAAFENATFQMGLSLSDDEAELVWLIASGGASDGKRGWCFLRMLNGLFNWVCLLCPFFLLFLSSPSVFFFLSWIYMCAFSILLSTQQGSDGNCTGRAFAIAAKKFPKTTQRVRSASISKPGSRAGSLTRSGGK